MKKLYLIILWALLSLTATAQTIGDAFYIYRNDGQFNAFFRNEIDSITYSCYDLDSTYCEDYVTQVIYTSDSIYQIPLAAIDSVGFVQPETKYKDDAVPLTGSLFDYLIKADSLTLTFDALLPIALIPQKGDKLVATDVSSKLPCGFVGKVRQVSTETEGIIVQCDSIGLGDALSKFYGVYDILVGENNEAKVRGPRKAPWTTEYPYDLPAGRRQLPPIDLSAFVREKNIFDINYKNTLDIAFDPVMHIRVTRVIDDNPLLAFTNHTNLFAVLDVDTEMKFDISGEAKAGSGGPDKKGWRLSCLPSQDFPIPPGIVLYFDLGVKASLSGEIATAFTVNNHLHVVSDITFYDASLLPIIGPMVNAAVNRVDGSVNITTFDMTWDYIGFRAELKPNVYVNLGLSAGHHDIGWVGGEFEGGVKLNGELMFDFNRLRNAEPETALYDELKELAKIDVKPYFGAHFVASAVYDRYAFRFGQDFENPRWIWYQGRILPGFSNTKATPLSETKARVTADITNDCFIPYTVGFALYDENNHHIDTQIYQANGTPIKYWTRNAFHSFVCDFEGLDKTKKYKVYPIIRFFGQHDMLASPSADLMMDVPVTITDFKVTKSEYKNNGFTNDGKSYDYCFYASTTVKLEKDKDVADWGYVYKDPDGEIAHISLRNFGTSYTDTRYAYYRNETKSTCTLYGYVKYVGDDEYYYGEPHDYPLEYGETSCPDENHPHMIDLGLPSGTKWACCNVGASKPEEYGGYYAWGETLTKSYYGWNTYQYYDSETGYVNLGSDIAGTSYDAATANWGAPWRMPSLEQIKELLSYTTSQWTTQNGVYGRKFTGSNGGTVFLPAAGGRWLDELYDEGSLYWSSSLSTDYSDYAYGLYFNSGNADWDYDGYRHVGSTVRPVRKN